MNSKIISGKQSKIFLTRIILFLLIGPAIFLICSSGIPIDIVKGAFYIPAPPEGDVSGFVNVVYEYRIMTLNQNATWRFDWGDGTLTPWLQLLKGQTSINQTHHWNSPGTYHVRVQFKNQQIPDGVWSSPLNVTISAFSNADFPMPPFIVCGTIQGFTRITYWYTFTTGDPQINQISYLFDWGNGTPSEWSSFILSTSVFVIPHTWALDGDYFIKVKARNQYFLESPWSDPIHITIKNNTDNTGRTIDLVVINGDEDHIMFTSNRSGTFYNSSSGASSVILWTDTGEYLIDDDCDGQWDYLYSAEKGQILQEPDQTFIQKDFFSGIPWMLLLIIGGVIIGIICVVVVLIKTGYIYISEENIVEK
jgi:hypothetical protein